MLPVGVRLPGPRIFHVVSSFLSDGVSEESVDDVEAHIKSGGDAAGGNDPAGVDVAHLFLHLATRGSLAKEIVTKVVSGGRQAIK